MKIVTYTALLFFIQSCCTSNSNNCEDDEISYGIDCIKSNNNVFYESTVNFLCFNESILIGLDSKNKKLNPFFINDFNPVNTNIMNVQGSIDYSKLTLFYGFNETCEINGEMKTVWLLFDDLTQFDKTPSKIIAKLALKESIDFNSKTIEEKEIVLMQR